LHVPSVDRHELGLASGGEAIVHFTHPLCSECREWEDRLEREGADHVLVDVRARPDLAHKYGIAVVPTVVSVGGDGTVLARLAP
jgi:thioredoxin-like negative regulator of GroEL